MGQNEGPSVAARDTAAPSSCHFKGLSHAIRPFPSGCTNRFVSNLSASRNE